ncbi:N-acetyltransferase [Aestuariirhabdus litorea]|uniref:N-acetyltransferase n=1 Tax=Aestuariirhabdus litorea TaxID=2528527 RepID=A0A3P3VP86_9GAMM|nr:N-acetyltransferase [Aestuariirhabdus litorea]RWW93686.1 GNAT family N-acetyltransferase [Endozoicomonadaceae bacterium GTF-13]
MTSERLEITPLRLADAGDILRLLNDADFLRFIGDRGVRTLEDACDYLRRGPLQSYSRHGIGLWRVGLRQTGAMIGVCGLLCREPLEMPDLGYALLMEFRHQGYAREASQRVLDYARDGLQLPRVLALVDPLNEDSIGLLNRLGFRPLKQLQLEAQGPSLLLLVKRLAPRSGPLRVTPAPSRGGAC